MESTRQRILEYLHIRRTCSAPELGRALHLTEADIRHHLSVLTREGVVEVVSQRPAEGRGRPAQVYGLTQQASQHNLGCLASALLEEMLQAIPPEEHAAFLKGIARRMVGEGLPQSRNPSQRLLEAVQRLNAMNYLARWEAHREGPRVIFAHCPYAAIVADHPELCRVDRLLLEQMLGKGVTQTAKLESSPQGATQCIFQIEK